MNLRLNVIVMTIGIVWSRVSQHFAPTIYKCGGKNRVKALIIESTWHLSITELLPAKGKETFVDARVAMETTIPMDFWIFCPQSP